MLTHEYVAHWFVGQEYMGEGRVLLDPTWTCGRTPGRVYFCPACADIWARILVDGHDACGENRYCLRHGNGTLRCQDMPDIREDQPPLRALQYEFLRAVEWGDRYWLAFFWNARRKDESITGTAVAA
jgi:hypothetical protein